MLLNNDVKACLWTEKDLVMRQQWKPVCVLEEMSQKHWENDRWLLNVLAVIMKNDLRAPNHLDFDNNLLDHLQTQAGLFSTQLCIQCSNMYTCRAPIHYSTYKHTVCLSPQLCNLNNAIKLISMNQVDSRWYKPHNHTILSQCSQSCSYTTLMNNEHQFYSCIKVLVRIDTDLMNKFQ